jgi:uncharacterized membrane protein HdeD (DUF308 family)
MQKMSINEDVVEVIKDIRKSKRLWGNILFVAINSFVAILGVLLYTKNIVSVWSILLCIPVGPIFVALLCFCEDSEGLRSFESKYSFGKNVDRSENWTPLILMEIGIIFLIILGCFGHWILGLIALLLFFYMASGTIDDDSSDNSGGPCDCDTGGF